MKLVVLTAEQADKLRGRHGKYSALDPIALPDGMFMIPENCLKDKDLKDAYKKMDDAVKANGMKELNKLSEAETVNAGEYYIDDISPMPDEPEQMTGNLIKCIKDADNIDPDDNKVFLKSSPQVLTINK